MLTAEDAERCIKNLNRTEIDGKVITAEKAKFTQGMSRKSAEIEAVLDSVAQMI